MLYKRESISVCFILKKIKQRAAKTIKGKKMIHDQERKQSMKADTEIVKKDFKLNVIKVQKF